MADKVEKRILTLYSDVQATSVHWLWYPFIAVGKITLLQGDPGDGKSTMMMNLIAELSKGGKTPDGKPVGTPQRVIYQCSEDGVSNSGEIKCMALVRMIYGDSGWDKKMSYRLLGRAFPQQRLVSFKITDAMQIENGRVLTEM